MRPPLPEEPPLLAREICGVRQAGSSDLNARSLPSSLTNLVGVILEGIDQVGDDLLHELRVAIALPVGSQEILSCANSALHYILF